MYGLSILVACMLVGSCSVLFDEKPAGDAGVGVVADGTDSEADADLVICDTIRIEDFEANLDNGFWDRNGIVAGAGTSQKALTLSAGPVTPLAELFARAGLDYSGLEFTVNFRSIDFDDNSGEGIVNVSLDNQSADPDVVVAFEIGRSQLNYGAELPVSGSFEQTAPVPQVDLSQPFGLRIRMDTAAISYSIRTGMSWQLLQQHGVEPGELAPFAITPRIATLAEGGAIVTATIEDLSLMRCPQ